MADFQSERQGEHVELAVTWYRREADAMKAQGATWFRFSSHVDDHTRLMVEGWKVRPLVEGPPRWSEMPARALR